MKDFDKPAFCERMLIIRKKMGLNQQQMATALDVSTKTLSKYEIGTNIPKIDFIARTINYTKVDPNWLIFGETEINKKNLIEELFGENADRDEKLLKIIEALQDPVRGPIAKNEFENALIYAQEKYPRTFGGDKQILNYTKKKQVSN